jgi:hypothetical protein
MHVFNTSPVIIRHNFGIWMLPINVPELYCADNRSDIVCDFVGVVLLRKYVPKLHVIDNGSRVARNYVGSGLLRLYVLRLHFIDNGTRITGYVISQQLLQVYVPKLFKPELHQGDVHDNPLKHIHILLGIGSCGVWNVRQE